MTTDEGFTGRTGELLAGLAMFRDSSVPAPSPELASLFEATATAAPSALPTPRRAPVYKRFLSGVPSKIAAATLGALLAGGLGAGAGALTGAMTLTSSEDDAPAVEVPAVDDQPAAADEPADVEDGSDDAAEPVAVDEVDDDGANDAAADADLAAVPVPTSVSEAAHTHEFDEACGNHGHYVSAFAHDGEEPQCAADARPEGDVGSEDAVEAEGSGQVELLANVTTKDEVKGGRKAGTSGGNWQSEPDAGATLSAESTKKGGR